MKNLQSCTPPTTEKRLLTTQEAADLLSLKKGTLEIWRWSGKGPNFLKLGRACRYRLEDLQQFMQKATRTSTSCDF